MAESALPMYVYYRRLLDGISPKSRYDTGWALYSDTQYTESSPLVINQGVTAQLANNAGSVIDTYLPQGIDAFYEDGKIKGHQEGDSFEWSIRFKVKSSIANGAFAVKVDIGGDLGIILEDTRRLVRGSNSENFFNISFTGYTLDTFLANGGTVKFESISGDSSVYDISFLIVRTHAVPPQP